MARTRAMENRAIRQEALREQLSAQGHIQHVIDICAELNELTKPLEAVEVNRKKIVIDTKLKLINKYCPDLKQTELTGPDGGPLQVADVSFTFNPVDEND